MLDLDEHDAVYRQLQNTLQIQVAALARCQSDNGLWPTLLNDPDSYLEASATAGFCRRHLQSDTPRLSGSGLSAGGRARLRGNYRPYFTTG